MKIIPDWSGINLHRRSFQGFWGEGGRVVSTPAMRGRKTAKSGALDPLSTPLFQREEKQELFGTPALILKVFILL